MDDKGKKMKVYSLLGFMDYEGSELVGDKLESVDSLVEYVEFQRGR